MLIAKFSRRWNIRRGCILRIPCLCREPEPMARVLCPVHRIWPQQADRAQTGERLLPKLKHSPNRHLRANLAAAGISQSDRFSSHFFRRGATQELQIAGSPDEELNRAGCWRWMGCRSYIDTQLTDALEISRLISRPTDSDSDGGPDAPTAVACEDALRRRLRPFPGRGYTKLGAIQYIDGGYRIRWCSISWADSRSDSKKCYPDGRLPGVADAHGPPLLT